MNKLELNDKLAELYKIPKIALGRINQLTFAEVLLIDDWSRLMDLAVDNKVNIILNEGVVMCTNDRKVVDSIEFMSEHDTQKEATRYAIAMALVKLAEDK